MRDGRYARQDGDSPDDCENNPLKGIHSERIPHR